MELIPCVNCGQAVADYRAICPFCGASTGRPAGTPPPPDPAQMPRAPATITNSVGTPTTPSTPRRELTHNAKVGIGALTVIIVLAVIIGVATSGSDSSDQKLSAAAKTYLDRAMPALAQVTSEYESGNVAQAAADWKAIGDFPVNNTTDDYVSKDYLTYANNVRYFMVGDGSVNLKQLEDSKTKAEQTIAALE